MILPKTELIWTEYEKKDRKLNQRQRKSLKIQPNVPIRNAMEVVLKDKNNEFTSHFGWPNDVTHACMIRFFFSLNSCFRVKTQNRKSKKENIKWRKRNIITSRAIKKWIRFEDSILTGKRVCFRQTIELTKWKKYKTKVKKVKKGKIKKKKKSAKKECFYQQKKKQQLKRYLEFFFFYLICGIFWFLI